MKRLIVGTGLILSLFLSPSLIAQIITSTTLVETTTPLIINQTISGDLIKKVEFDLSITSSYANLSLYADDVLLIDEINIPSTGNHQLSALVEFQSASNVDLKIVAFGGDVTINTMDFATTSLTLPTYADISNSAGIDHVESLKYGGPAIADIDNDGDYDFIVVNHNDESNKIYWNNGDGTVTKHNPDITRWFMQDLHGATFGDYDNDGDLDLIQTRGGGNGTTPSYPDVYRNDDGVFVLVTGDIGLNAENARGRGAKWSDMDQDGDLDVILVNAPGINGETLVHVFYENNGDGTFTYRSIPDIENVTAERALLTDINGDQIDDIIFFGWNLSLWIGNGDFTFTEATDQFPGGMATTQKIIGMADVDIDNDGDLDLYIARGSAFGIGTSPTFDFDPIGKQVGFKVRNGGSYEINMSVPGSLGFKDFIFGPRNGFDPSGANYPIYLGSAKTIQVIDDTSDLTITAQSAEGWPTDITANGIYIGHLGGGEWRATVVSGTNIHWSVEFVLSGVDNAVPEFTPLNRNVNDILLKNENGSFVDVSAAWKIPEGNHAGVSVGDVNNDGNVDLFIHRWGNVASKPSDYLLLNNGTSFETVTMHGAADPDDRGNGDMGQIFDFDLDGKLDMLNGGEEGAWYLFNNTSATIGNYALVDVGYAPESNIDPMGAVVVVNTPTKEYTRRLVGSSGEVFSQSLLNIVHFGLGTETDITSITVTWRDGEQVVITNKTANQIFDTDSVDPTSIVVTPSPTDVRFGTSLELEAEILPINANQNITWTSSDDGIISVTPEGVITAEGTVGQTATITATSDVNTVKGTSLVEIVTFYPVDVASVELATETETVIEGEQITLSAQAYPKHADNTNITWETSDPLIATVDVNGVVTTHAFGDVTITARSEQKIEFFDTTLITVRESVEAFISFDDSSYYLTTDFDNSGTMTITVDYHVGTGKHVVAGDFGGIRFYLRHMDGWSTVVRDIIVDVPEALGTESGRASATLDLAGAIPTSELPDGQFYFIYVDVKISDGTSMNIPLAGNITLTGSTNSIDENDFDNRSVAIYPNPGLDLVYFFNVADADVEFFDTRGQLQLRQSIKNGDSVSVAELASGVYNVRVSQNGHTETLKFIKE